MLPDESAYNVIQEIAKLYKSKKIKLVGHASRSGTNSSQEKSINMEISFSRANKIKNLLVKEGFLEENILVEGKGDLEPTTELSDNNYNEAADRRVEVFYITE